MLQSDLIALLDDLDELVAIGMAMMAGLTAVALVAVHAVINASVR